MIGTELIRELIETIILTGKTKNVEPVSLLLIATPESGKTSVVLEKDCKSIKAFADLTGRGLHEVLKTHKEVTHIIINDMVSTLSHKQSVNKYIISQLNAMTEEGITNIATPRGVESFDIGKRGLIASLTLELAKDSRHWWNRIGFTSRMFPFCYQYPAELIVKIKACIDENAVDGHMPITIKRDEFFIPQNPLKVRYPENCLKEVRQISDLRSVRLQEQGLRRLKQYHGIVQAHALWRGRSKPEVNHFDVDFLRKVDGYVSYDKPEPL